jgi:hypothetical protein
MVDLKFEPLKDMMMLIILFYYTYIILINTCCVSMGQEVGRLSCWFILPVIDPCFFFIGDFLLFVVVIFWGALVLVVVCPLFLCIYLKFIRFWWSILLVPLYFLQNFLLCFVRFLFIYNIFVIKKKLSLSIVLLVLVFTINIHFFYHKKKVVLFVPLVWTIFCSFIT